MLRKSMSHRPLSWFAFLSLIAPVGAAADDDLYEDALTIRPSSEWTIREYDDKCRMRRTFGGGDDQVLLWLDQGSAAPTFNLTLIGRPFRHPFGTRLTVQFLPEPEYSRNYLEAQSSSGRPVISLFGARLTPTPAELAAAADEREKSGEETVDFTAATSIASVEESPMSPERIAAITELRLRGPLMERVILRTGPLTEPLAELQDCAVKVSNQIAENSRIAIEAGTPSEPTEIERWTGILQQNYPMDMLREEEEGRIGVVLTIGTNGKPSYCEVSDVAGPTSFNDTVCLLLLRHATFEPARNGEGEPIVSRYATRVTFRLNS